MIIILNKSVKLASFKGGGWGVAKLDKSVNPLFGNS